MKFYRLRPEDCGVLGEDTQIERSATRVDTRRIHIEFELFPQDDAIYIPWGICLVSLPLADAIRSSQLSGFELKAPHKLTLSPMHVAGLWQGRTPEDLPTLEWLRFTGRPNLDDFGSPDGVKLIASEQALKLFQQFKVSKMEIEPGDT